jgi:hypothetical protein
MNPDTPVIDIDTLVRRYGRTDAVNGLHLRVQPGRCVAAGGWMLGRPDARGAAPGTNRVN